MVHRSKKTRQKRARETERAFKAEAREDFTKVDLNYAQVVLFSPQKYFARMTEMVLGFYKITTLVLELLFKT